MKTWILFALLFPFTVHACIWDADTLSHEKSRNHDLAKVILGQEPAPADDTKQLQSRINGLEAKRNETDPDWWNNLAGAYIRLGRPQKAADLLEPVLAKFPDNYGIHANLGTAYHLLGRYADAEKEIARDLEINPDAHFGLEKYHLALLQYLARDAKYQSRHVYVDECTDGFLTAVHGGHIYFRSDNSPTKSSPLDYTNKIAEMSQAQDDYDSRVKDHADGYELMQALAAVADLDSPPAYRAKWNLATDTNFEAGVIYMAQMNPKEPACLTMLGVAAWKKRDYNLAASAFEKAIALGSPQSEILSAKDTDLRHYITESLHNRVGTPIGIILLWLIPVVITFYIYTKIRDRRRSRQITVS